MKGNLQQRPFDFRKKGYIKGLAYEIKQHPTMGHLCGYVRLPRDHGYYKRVLAKRWGVTYDGKYHCRILGYDEPTIARLRVHGGVTFAGRARGRRGVWIGFDCAHLGDRSPGIDEVLRMSPFCTGDVFRDVDFVMQEIELLADQLALLR